MKNFLNLLVCMTFLLISSQMKAQEEEASQKDIPELLTAYNKMSVPYLSVQMLKMEFTDYLVLDTRKEKEYKVSHIPGAIWVGEKYDLKNLPEVEKHKKIVVYCSVGIRSEDYGEKMLKDNFKSVFNLYGSIFSWKDAGYELEDNNGKPTDEVHVYSKAWSKYLKTGKKVY